MFMKHYAPNRCEPRIKVIVKMGIQLGRGGGVDVNEELVILGGGGGGGGGWVGCEQTIEGKLL